MTFFSVDFLMKFKGNSHFQLCGPAIEYTKKFAGCGTCQYPIVPLGVFKGDGTTESKVRDVAINTAKALGLGLVCTLGTSSPFIGIGTGILGFLTLSKGKEVAQIATGFAICPAAIRGMVAKVNKSVKGQLLVERQQAHAMIVGVERYRLTQLHLTKDGITYDAYFITSGEKISSKWVIHALDGNQSADWPMCDDTTHYETYQLYPNHCFISGPSVGRSTGWPTANQIGSGFELGLQLLEEIGATHIIMEAKGIFAGATLAEAVKRHTFKENIKYLSLAIGTAGSLSAAANDHFSRIGWIMSRFLSQIEMDFNLETASQKLSGLKIQQIIVQHRDDKTPFVGSLPDSASLATRLEKIGLTEYQTVITDPKLDHSWKMLYAPTGVKDVLMERVEAFLNHNE